MNHYQNFIEIDNKNVELPPTKASPALFVSTISSEEIGMTGYSTISPSVIYTRINVR